MITGEEGDGGSKDSPFAARFAIPVGGGMLNGARAGAPVDSAATVVVAVHGITASHMAWTAVARDLLEDWGICVLAPDLRGRGRSARLPGPFGFAVHVADVLALLDAADAATVVLAGHSMGAYVAARFAVEHPDRVSSVVLVDGGLPIAVPADKDPDALLEETLGPAVTRLEQKFPTKADYIAMWRAHPALAESWNADVEAYVADDAAPAPDQLHPDAVRSVVSLDAVRTDGRELLLDASTRDALDHVSAPVRLLRAPRGPLGDENALIPEDLLAEFEAAHPQVRVERVADTNHYTIMVGEPGGSARVAAAIRAAAAERHS